jgi:hypothetical protein
MTKARIGKTRNPAQSFAVSEKLQPIDEAWRNFVFSYRRHEDEENVERSPFVQAAFSVFAHELAKNRFLLELLIQNFERHLPQAGALLPMPPHMQELNDALRRYWFPVRQIWRWWKL